MGLDHFPFISNFLTDITINIVQFLLPDVTYILYNKKPLTKQIFLQHVSVVIPFRMVIQHEMVIDGLCPGGRAEGMQKFLSGDRDKTRLGKR